MFIHFPWFDIAILDLFGPTKGSPRFPNKGLVNRPLEPLEVSPVRTPLQMSCEEIPSRSMQGTTCWVCPGGIASGGGHGNLMPNK